MTGENTDKKIAYAILATIFLSIVLCIVAGVFIVYGLFFSLILTVATLRLRGLSSGAIFGLMGRDIYRIRMLFPLFILIGGIVSLWITSGVVPTMLYYGLKLLKGQNVLFMAFVIMMGVGMLMGTPFGAISSMGLTLMGIGSGFQIPKELLVGAIVSGAYLADRCSPLSSVFNMNLMVMGFDYREGVRYMLRTLIPAILISGLLYYMLGLSYIEGEGQLETQLLQELTQFFNIHPLWLLVSVAVVAMVFFGIPLLFALLITMLPSVGISLFVQKVAPGELVRSMLTGYRAPTDAVYLGQFLQSGGIRSMVPIIFLITFAVCLCSLLLETDLLEPVFSKLRLRIQTSGQLIGIAGVLSFFLTAISDQSVPILVEEKLFRETCTKRNIHIGHLLHGVCEGGMSVSPIFPWKGNGLFVWATLGVSAYQYTPYAFLCLLSPILLMIWAFVRIKREAGPNP